MSGTPGRKERAQTLAAQKRPRSSASGLGQPAEYTSSHRSSSPRSEIPSDTHNRMSHRGDDALVSLTEVQELMTRARRIMLEERTNARRVIARSINDISGNLETLIGASSDLPGDFTSSKQIQEPAVQGLLEKVIQAQATLHRVVDAVHGGSSEFNASIQDMQNGWRILKEHESNKNMECNAVEKVQSQSLAESANKRSLTDDISIDAALSTWLSNAGELFSAKIFAIELVGQTCFAFLGPIAIPFLYLLYGRSLLGLENRLMWGRSSLCSMFVGITVGWPLVAFTIIAIALGPYCEYGPSAIFVPNAGLVLRVLPIAMKYATFPLTFWYHLANTKLDFDEVASTLVLRMWLRVSQASVDTYAEASFISVLGPTFHDYTMRFVRNNNVDEAQSFCVRQGRSTRFVVEQLLEIEAVEKLDTSMPIMPKEAAAWECATELSLRHLFKLLAAAVVEMEERWTIEKVLLFPPAMINILACVISLSTIWVPILDGKQIRSFDGWNMALAVLPAWPVFILCKVNFTFLSVAIKDMWRRRALMRCCVALLSSSLPDRTVIPIEVRKVGILDLHNPETIQGFRKLVLICKDWGRHFGHRCTLFFGMFAAMGGVVTSWLIVAILSESSLVTRPLLYNGLSFMLVVGLAVLILVFFGEGANKAQGRVGVLLQKHHMALLGYVAGVRQPTRPLTDPEEVQELNVVVSLLESARASVLADCENEPFKILGQYCGFRLLTGIYALPAFLASTIWTYCGNNPDACSPDPTW